MADVLANAWTHFTSRQQRKQRLALGYLSLLGLVMPGWQRLYLGQFRSGAAYLILGLVPLVIPGWQWVVWIPRALSGLEAFWILILMDSHDFDNRFNRHLSGLEWASHRGEKTTDSERQLEEMRRLGVITDDEYKQRRQEQQERLRKP